MKLEKLKKNKTIKFEFYMVNPKKGKTEKSINGSGRFGSHVFFGERKLRETNNWFGLAR